MFDNFGFSVDTIIRALNFDLATILAQASDLEVLCSTHGLNLHENLLPIVQNFEEKANSLRADLETELEQERAAEAAQALAIEHFKQFQAEREAKKRQKVGIIPVTPPSQPQEPPIATTNEVFIPKTTTEEIIMDTPTSKSLETVEDIAYPLPPTLDLKEPFHKIQCVLAPR
jgi:hypothetical protein